MGPHTGIAEALAAYRVSVQKVPETEKDKEKRTSEQESRILGQLPGCEIWFFSGFFAQGRGRC